MKKFGLQVDRKWLLFGCAVIAFLVSAYTKSMLGGDERVYLADGLFWIAHGTWPDPSSIPLYGIMVALGAKLFHHPLLSAQFIYILFGSLIVFPLYYFANVFFDPKASSFSVLLLILMPGLLVLPLYSGTTVMFVAIAYCGLALLHYSITTKKTGFSLLTGFLLGLSYLARPDGLVYLLLTLLLLCLFGIAKKSKTYYLHALFLLIGSMVSIAPWQIWLMLNHALVPTVIWSHGHPTAWLTLHQMIVHPAMINGTILHLFLLKIVLMLRLYSETLASIRFIPIYIWIFVGVGIMQLVNKELLWILGVPILCTFSYLFFHVLGRYLTPMIPAITLFGGAGIFYYSRSFAPASYFKLILFIVLGSLVLVDIFYLIFGHPTYKPHPAQTTLLYQEITAPSQAGFPFHKGHK